MKLRKVYLYCGYKVIIIGSYEKYFCVHPLDRNCDIQLKIRFQDLAKYNINKKYLNKKRCIATAYQLTEL